MLVASGDNSNLLPPLLLPPQPVSARRVDKYLPAPKQSRAKQKAGWLDRAKRRARSQYLFPFRLGGTAFVGSSVLTNHKSFPLRFLSSNLLFALVEKLCVALTQSFR